MLYLFRGKDGADRESTTGTIEAAEPQGRNLEGPCPALRVKVASTAFYAPPAWKPRPSSHLESDAPRTGSSLGPGCGNGGLPKSRSRSWAPASPARRFGPDQSRT